MLIMIWKSRLRFDSAHYDLEVAVEVRQYPLRLVVAVEVRQCLLGSGIRGGGPAVPSGIWIARRRRRRWRRNREITLIKSNDPYLISGEKENYLYKFIRNFTR